MRKKKRKNWACQTSQSVRKATAQNHSFLLKTAHHSLATTMGSANSALPTPETDFAFLVTKDAYDRDVRSASDAEIMVTPELMTKYRNIYDSAVKEYALPLGECQSPSVVHYKYRYVLTDEEQKEFVETIVASALDREKKRERANKEKAKKEVFDDKSFSGTKEDSQAEKEAAAILRGTSGGTNAAIDDFENFPLLQPPGRLGVDDDQQGVLRSVSVLYHTYVLVVDMVLTVSDSCTD